MQQRRPGVGIAGKQRGDSLLGVLQQPLAVGRGRVEQGVDPAGVGHGEAGLGALQHLGEPVTPGDVEPRRVGGLGVGGGVAVADRELDVARQPLTVGHLGDVAEVRLGGGRHRGDDLLAARGDRVGVTGDLVEQPAAARGGVVDLVDVGPELAAPGCHAVHRFSGTDPAIGAGGVDQQLLDRRRGGGLQAGHRRGADQDAVDRHQRVAVGLRPLAGQVLRGPLGRADAAADADRDVGRGRATRSRCSAAGRRGPPRSGGRRRGRPRCGR